MQRAFWLICLLVLAGAASAADRLEVLIGPHLSSEDGSDSAGHLQGFMQARINNLAALAFEKPALQAYIASHFADVKPGIKPAVISVLANAWDTNPTALVLIAGLYEQDEKTFISTLYVGPKTSDFSVPNATVNILAKASFLNDGDMATLLFYYAMVRDARAQNKGREIIVPIASSALEIARGLKLSEAPDVDEAMVTAIEADLNKVVSEAQVQP